MELEKIYNPKDIEKKWYTFWENSGFFKPHNKKGTKNYSIMLPPPNVTGTLHMGHGFQHTLQDILIRYHRMLGENTLWQPGVDHAGIATQMVVERNLEAQGILRKDIGREAFIEKIWQWKQYSGDTITKQMRRLGASCDWSRERFTMDDDFYKIVVEIFVRLYEEGLIYRSYKLVNWDVRRQTAVSDLEVKYTEEQGSLWYIKYPIENSNNFLVVATTRPETMLGDVAVAVNPKDPRYNHLIGQKVVLPLTTRLIPIIADDYVDIEFGTGCVKITPSHDFNDYEIAKRHNLPMMTILTLDGYLNSAVPDNYRGLERFVARKKIVADLMQLGLLESTKPHKLMVPRGERDDVILEPMLTHQWFVNMQNMANKGTDLVKTKIINFVPDNWKTTYFQWLDNIQDWCISRQLWWGHRIPAFYDKNGNIFVARSYADAVKLANTTELTQDEDVLDTWFSSALWCFSTLGWPHDTQDIRNFLPSNVLVTGFDIIFFWVARMIMFTEHFTHTIPFKEVYITGLIQDAHGQKMSKSKGNIIDPIDLIDGISLDELMHKRTQNLMNPKQAQSIALQTAKDYPEGFMPFGADALRFGFTLIATNNQEIRFDIKRVEVARNFCNKLWNAARFILMNIANVEHLLNLELNLTYIDNWILGRLAELIKDIEFAYSTYRFDLAAQKIYEFVWNDFCDWYLELAKVNLASMNNDSKTATINTLLKVLECILRLAHPFIPFITEEIWQVIAPLINKKTVDSIMIATYPSLNEIVFIASATQQVQELQMIIGEIRNLRALMNISPAVKVPCIVQTTNLSKFVDNKDYIQALAKVSEIQIVPELITSFPIAIIGDTKLSLEVQIDKNDEFQRLVREIEKLELDINKIQLKLNNSNFIMRAPQEIVEKEKMKFQELSMKVNNLRNQLEYLK